ncbi:MAG: 3-methyl-2-oxobutanoate hydroxymethyltransferase [Coriobacteriia bacterium]|nr:3-methyl-2-oxobutanoate hydroxymethyltransferase [Coriobacteriia bacterium]
MSTQKSGKQAGSKHFTTQSFAAYKQAKKRIVMCTAYDYMQAGIVETAGVDAILVGDSLGMTTLGYDSTLPVTMDDMLRATAAVVKGAPASYVIADMPFMSYQHSHDAGMQNAAALIAQSGANAVKIEGASVEAVLLIESLVAAGIPVVGHLGLTPQSINALGSYSTQAKETSDIIRLMLDAHAIMTAGVCAIVLECVPAEVAEELAQMHLLPIIGIGSGVHCDGEVQVFHDLLGLGGDFKPRHAKRFLDGADILTDAVGEYVQAVRARTFPTDAQATSIDPNTVEEATSVFVEHLIEEAEFADSELEFFLDDAADGFIDAFNGAGDDESDQSSYFGGSRAHLN